MVRAVCLGLVIVMAGAVAAGPARAEVGASPNPTSQAIAADAQFLEYAPPPAQPGVVCLVDSGVDPNPDTVGTLVGAEAEVPSWGAADGLAQVLPRVEGHLAGHGTEMAMLMAAPQNGWGMVGIAPTSVRVYSIRVVPPGATSFPFSGYSYAINACLHIRIAGTAAIAVVNLSLAGPTMPAAADLADLADSVDTARQHGVNVVAAAGNDGGGVASYPAAYPSVFAVGASDAADQTVPCGFSALKLIDILAPGCNSVNGGIDQVFEDDGSPAVGYGSSQAAAITSAVLAAMHAYGPGISVTEAELCLSSSELEGGNIDVAKAFRHCGLSSVVEAGLAAASQQAATSDGTTTATSPTGTVGGSDPPLAKPRIGTTRLRKGKLMLRVLNWRSGLAIEVKVLAKRGYRTVVVARRVFASGTLSLTVRVATSVKVRFVLLGPRMRASPWVAKVVG